MNKEEQGRFLLERLIDISPGLYLLDTDMSDGDIEHLLSRLDKIKYYKEELIPSKGGSPFELCIIGLCRQIECAELDSTRQLFLSSNEQQKENVRYDLLITLCRLLCGGKKCILHLSGEIDITYFANEELSHFNSAINHNTIPTVLLCKKKTEEAREVNKHINILSLKNPIRMNNKLELVHITYKHNDHYKTGLEAIERGLKKNNIPFSIDNYDILYRDDIQEYEKEIGMSYRVIMFVIPEYLESIDCMYEMTQLFRNGSINDRIFPIVDLGSVPRNGDGLKRIKDYWQNEKKRKAEQISTEPGGSAFVLGEIVKIDNIIKALDDFWDFIVHKYTGAYNDMIANDAEKLMQEIRKSVVPVNVSSDFVPSGDTAPNVTRVVNQGDKALYIENNTGTININ